MEDIEYLEEYEDLILQTIQSNNRTVGGFTTNTNNNNMMQDEDSSSIDQDIFESLFDDHSDDESNILQKKADPKLSQRGSYDRASLDSLDMLVKDLVGEQNCQRKTQTTKTNPVSILSNQSKAPAQLQKKLPTTSSMNSSLPSSSSSSISRITQKASVSSTSFSPTSSLMRNRSSGSSFAKPSTIGRSPTTTFQKRPVVASNSYEKLPTANTSRHDVMDKIDKSRSVATVRPTVQQRQQNKRFPEAGTTNTNVEHILSSTPRSSSRSLTSLPTRNPMPGPTTSTRGPSIRGGLSQRGGLSTRGGVGLVKHPTPTMVKADKRDTKAPAEDPLSLDDIADALLDSDTDTFSFSDVSDESLGSLSDLDDPEHIIDISNDSSIDGKGNNKDLDNVRTETPSPTVSDVDSSPLSKSKTSNVDVIKEISKLSREGSMSESKESLVELFEHGIPEDDVDEEEASVHSSTKKSAGEKVTIISDTLLSRIDTALLDTAVMDKPNPAQNEFQDQSNEEVVAALERELMPYFKKKNSTESTGNDAATGTVSRKLEDISSTLSDTSLNENSKILFDELTESVFSMDGGNGPEDKNNKELEDILNNETVSTKNADRIKNKQLGAGNPFEEFSDQTQTEINTQHQKGNIEVAMEVEVETVIQEETDLENFVGFDEDLESAMAAEQLNQNDNEIAEAVADLEENMKYAKNQIEEKEEEEKKTTKEQTLKKLDETIKMLEEDEKNFKSSSSVLKSFSRKRPAKVEHSSSVKSEGSEETGSIKKVFKGPTSPMDKQTSKLESKSSELTAERKHNLKPETSEGVESKYNAPPPPKKSKLEITDGSQHSYDSKKFINKSKDQKQETSQKSSLDLEKAKTRKTEDGNKTPQTPKQILNKSQNTIIEITPKKEQQQKTIETESRAHKKEVKITPSPKTTDTRSVVTSRGETQTTNNSLTNDVKKQGPKLDIRLLPKKEKTESSMESLTAKPTHRESSINSGKSPETKTQTATKGAAEKYAEENDSSKDSAKKSMVEKLKQRPQSSEKTDKDLIEPQKVTYGDDQQGKTAKKLAICFSKEAAEKDTDTKNISKESVKKLIVEKQKQLPSNVKTDKSIIEPQKNIPGDNQQGKTTKELIATKEATEKDADTKDSSKESVKKSIMEKEKHLPSSEKTDKGLIEPQKIIPVDEQKGKTAKKVIATKGAAEKDADTKASSKETTRKTIVEKEKQLPSNQKSDKGLIEPQKNTPGKDQQEKTAKKQMATKGAAEKVADTKESSKETAKKSIVEKEKQLPSNQKIDKGLIEPQKITSKDDQQGKTAKKQMSTKGAAEKDAHTKDSSKETAKKSIVEKEKQRPSNVKTDDKGLIEAQKITSADDQQGKTNVESSQNRSENDKRNASSHRAPIQIKFKRPTRKEETPKEITDDFEFEQIHSPSSEDMLPAKQVVKNVNTNENKKDYGKLTDFEKVKLQLTSDAGTKAEQMENMPAKEHENKNKSISDIKGKELQLLTLDFKKKCEEKMETQKVLAQQQKKEDQKLKENVKVVGNNENAGTSQKTNTEAEKLTKETIENDKPKSIIFNKSKQNFESAKELKKEKGATEGDVTQKSKDDSKFNRSHNRTSAVEVLAQTKKTEMKTEKSLEDKTKNKEENKGHIEQPQTEVKLKVTEALELAKKHQKPAPSKNTDNLVDKKKATTVESQTTEVKLTNPTTFSQSREKSREIDKAKKVTTVKSVEEDSKVTQTKSTSVAAPHHATKKKYIKLKVKAQSDEKLPEATAAAAEREESKDNALHANDNKSKTDPSIALTRKSNTDPSITLTRKSNNTKIGDNKDGKMSTESSTSPTKNRSETEKILHSHGTRNAMKSKASVSVNEQTFTKSSPTEARSSQQQQQQQQQQLQQQPQPHLHATRKSTHKTIIEVAQKFTMSPKDTQNKISQKKPSTLNKIDDKLDSSGKGQSLAGKKSDIVEKSEGEGKREKTTSTISKKSHKQQQQTQANATLKQQLQQQPQQQQQNISKNKTETSEKAKLQKSHTSLTFKEWSEKQKGMLSERASKFEVSPNQKAKQQTSLVELSSITTSSSTSTSSSRTTVITTSTKVDTTTRKSLNDLNNTQKKSIKKEGNSNRNLQVPPGTLEGRHKTSLKKTDATAELKTSLTTDDKKRAEDKKDSSLSTDKKEKLPLAKEQLHSGPSESSKQKLSSEKMQPLATTEGKNCEVIPKDYSIEELNEIVKGSTISLCLQKTERGTTKRPATDGAAANAKTTTEAKKYVEENVLMTEKMLPVKTKEAITEKSYSTTTAAVKRPKTDKETTQTLATTTTTTTHIVRRSELEKLMESLPGILAATLSNSTKRRRRENNNYKSPTPPIKESKAPKSPSQRIQFKTPTAPPPTKVSSSSISSLPTTPTTTTTTTKPESAKNLELKGGRQQDQQSQPPEQKSSSLKAAAPAKPFDNVSKLTTDAQKARHVGLFGSGLQANRNFHARKLRVRINRSTVRNYYHSLAAAKHGFTPQKSISILQHQISSDSALTKMTLPSTEGSREAPVLNDYKKANTGNTSSKGFESGGKTVKQTLRDALIAALESQVTASTTTNNSTKKSVNVEQMRSDEMMQKDDNGKITPRSHSPTKTTESSLLTPLKSGTQESVGTGRQTLQQHPPQQQQEKRSARLQQQQQQKSAMKQTQQQTSISFTQQRFSTNSPIAAYQVKQQQQQLQQQQQQSNSKQPSPVFTPIEPKKELDDEQQTSPSICGSSDKLSVASAASTATTISLLTGGLPTTAVDNSGTRLYTFLHPAKYNRSHGAVLLDYCCPNLDGPMPALDPTREHAQLQSLVRELPAYIVMTTKVVTRADLEAKDNSIPASIRRKMEKLTSTALATSATASMRPQSATTATIQSMAAKATPPPPLTPAPTVVAAAATSTMLPTGAAPPLYAPTISALQRQLPPTTTLTPKRPAMAISTLPESPPRLTTFSTSSAPTAPSTTSGQFYVGTIPVGMGAITAQQPPAPRPEFMRALLRSNLRRFDSLLKKHSFRINELTYLERQRIIDALVSKAIYGPNDVEQATRLLEDYCQLLNTSLPFTKSASQLPSQTSTINTATATTATPTIPVSIAAASPSTLTSAQTPASAVAAQQLEKLHANAVQKVRVGGAQSRRQVPIYDKDRNIIGYQMQIGSVKLPIASSAAAAAAATATSTNSTMSTTTSAITSTNGSTTVTRPRFPPNHFGAVTTTSLKQPAQESPRIFYTKPIQTSTPISGSQNVNSSSASKKNTASSPTAMEVSNRLGHGITIRQVTPKSSPQVNNIITRNSALSKLLNQPQKQIHMNSPAASRGISTTAAATAAAPKTVTTKTNVTMAPTVTPVATKRVTRHTASSGTGQVVIITTKDKDGNNANNDGECILPDDERNAAELREIKREEEDVFIG